MAIFTFPAGAFGVSVIYPGATYRLSDDTPDRLCGGDDGYALVVSAKAKQMAVAGDDQVGTGGDSGGQHLIVIGVVGDDALDAARQDNAGEAVIVVQQRGRRCRDSGDCLRQLVSRALRGQSKAPGRTTGAE